MKASLGPETTDPKTGVVTRDIVLTVEPIDDRAQLTYDDLYFEMLEWDDLYAVLDQADWDAVEAEVRMTGQRPWLPAEARRMTQAEFKANFRTWTVPRFDPRYNPPSGGR